MKTLEMMTRQEIEQGLRSRADDDEEFRALLLNDPIEALSKTYGSEIAAGINLTVHEEGFNDFHMVIPPRSRLTEADMAQITGGYCNGNGPCG